MNNLDAIVDESKILHVSDVYKLIDLHNSKLKEEWYRPLVLNISVQQKYSICDEASIVSTLHEQDVLALLKDNENDMKLYFDPRMFPTPVNQKIEGKCTVVTTLVKYIQQLAL